uniref:Putative secreted protein n=1 Tax=Anopheles darlingi TaxID=43151 RepID=A0A2M4D3F5_ANODA
MARRELLLLLPVTPVTVECVSIFMLFIVRSPPSRPRFHSCDSLKLSRGTTLCCRNPFQPHLRPTLHIADLSQATRCLCECVCPVTRFRRIWVSIS